MRLIHAFWWKRRIFGTCLAGSDPGANAEQRRFAAQRLIELFHPYATSLIIASAALLKSRKINHHLTQNGLSNC